MKKFYLSMPDGGKKTELERRGIKIFDCIFQPFLAVMWLVFLLKDLKSGELTKFSRVTYPLLIVLSIANGIMAWLTAYNGTCPHCGEAVTARFLARKAKCKKCGEQSEIITETDGEITL